MADAIILNYIDFDTTKELANCLNNYDNIRHICIVDNASPNDSYEQLQNNSWEKVDVIRTEKNGGYGYGNNYGINYLKKKYNSEYILLCNPDIFIENEVVKKLEDYLKQHRDCIIAAPLMFNVDGIKQRNTAFEINNVYSYIMSFEIIYSKIFRHGMYEGIHNTSCEAMDVDAVAGSLFMFNVEKMIKYGMFDENIFLYCEERILGMKCKKAGLRITLLPRCNFIHYHSVSINKTIKSEMEKRLLLNKSALYVIKNYYHANIMGILLGKAVLYFSLVECLIIEIIKKIKI